MTDDLTSKGLLWSLLHALHHHESFVINSIQYSVLTLSPVYFSRRNNVHLCWRRVYQRKNFPHRGKSRFQGTRLVPARLNNQPATNQVEPYNPCCIYFPVKFSQCGQILKYITNLTALAVVSDMYPFI